MILLLWQSFVFFISTWILIWKYDDKEVSYHLSKNTNHVHSHSYRNIYHGKPYYRLLSEIHCVPYSFTQIEFKQVPNKYGILSSSKYICNITYINCDLSFKQKLLTFAFNTCLSQRNSQTSFTFDIIFMTSIKKHRNIRNKWQIFCTQKLSFLMMFVGCWIQECYVRKWQYMCFGNNFELSLDSLLKAFLFQVYNFLVCFAIGNKYLFIILCFRL